MAFLFLGLLRAHEAAMFPHQRNKILEEGNLVVYLVRRIIGALTLPLCFLPISLPYALPTVYCGADIQFHICTAYVAKQAPQEEREQARTERLQEHRNYREAQKNRETVSRLRSSRPDDDPAHGGKGCCHRWNWLRCGRKDDETGLSGCWKCLKREALTKEDELEQEIFTSVHNPQFDGKYSLSHGRRFQELERTFIVSMPCLDCIAAANRVCIMMPIGRCHIQEVE